MDGWKGRPLVTKTHIVDEVKLQLEVFGADRTAGPHRHCSRHVT